MYSPYACSHLVAARDFIKPDKSYSSAYCCSFHSSGRFSSTFFIPAPADSAPPLSSPLYRETQINDRGQIRLKELESNSL